MNLGFLDHADFVGAKRLRDDYSVSKYSEFNQMGVIAQYQSFGTGYPPGSPSSNSTFNRVWSPSFGPGEIQETVGNKGCYKRLRMRGCITPPLQARFNMQCRLVAFYDRQPVDIGEPPSYSDVFAELLPQPLDEAVVLNSHCNSFENPMYNGRFQILFDKQWFFEENMPDFIDGTYPTIEVVNNNVIPPIVGGEQLGHTIDFNIPVPPAQNISLETNKNSNGQVMYPAEYLQFDQIIEMDLPWVYNDSLARLKTGAIFYGFFWSYCVDPRLVVPWPPNWVPVARPTLFLNGRLEYDDGMPKYRRNY